MIPNMRVAILLTVLTCAQIQHVRSNSVVGNIVTRDGYYSEAHQVKTEDGYILEVNRIPYPRFQNESKSQDNRPVVFLMHGLMASATSFILLGPESSMAYNLADAGYDVWMGNARGVLNSRSHINLNPNNSEDKNEYFDYSFHEIGFYDVSAMVDYVLETTGEKQLHYIGHSQGGTTFFVLASARPEYNQKFKSVHLLAGVGYQDHFPSRILDKIAERTHLLYSAAVLMGYVEVLRPRNLALINRDINCSDNAVNKDGCDLLTAIETLGVIIDPTRQAHGTASIKQIAHFGQNVKDKAFRKWDYGSIRNIVHYGRLSPPQYDLRLISADITMHYTVSDRLQDEKDVLAMDNVMPNSKARKISDEKFLHSGFMFDPKVKTLVTDYIIEQINQH